MRMSLAQVQELVKRVSARPANAFTAFGPYGDPNPEVLGVILPGQSVKASRKYPQHTDIAECGAELTFQDADGTTFQRTANGYLSGPRPQRPQSRQSGIPHRAPGACSAQAEG